MTLPSYSAPPTESDPRPDCAICGGKVDSIQTWYDQLRRETYYVVRCHGDEESVALTDHLVAGATSLSPGVAFAVKRLATGKVDE